MNCLIHITLTIYDPGYKCCEEALEEGHDFWLTPIRNQSWSARDRYNPLDCVRPLRSEERDSWSTKLDVVFDKWAVGIDLMDVPLSCSTGEDYKSAVDFELQHMGMDRFAEYPEDIIEAFDPLIKTLPTKVDKWGNPHIHHISALTVWEYGSWRCNSPFDPEEWDDSWALIGILKTQLEVIRELD